MAGGDFPEFETYADVIDAYNSGVAVEPGESLTDYIKRNNIKIKEIDMDPLGDLEKTFKGAAGGRVNYALGTPESATTNKNLGLDSAKLVDELEPGSLKDELLKDFDPSQETYEEYLQRKSLEEVRLK